MTEDAPTPRKAWERGQRGWPADSPVVQAPNVPLLAALAAWLVAALTGGLLHHCARATSLTGLAAWAWKEVEDGANGARRAIGGAGLVFVIAKLAEALRT